MWDIIKDFYNYCKNNSYVPVPIIAFMVFLLLIFYKSILRFINKQIISLNFRKQSDLYNHKFFSDYNKFHKLIANLSFADKEKEAILKIIYFSKLEIIYFEIREFLKLDLKQMNSEQIRYSIIIILTKIQNNWFLKVRQELINKYKSEVIADKLFDIVMNKDNGAVSFFQNYSNEIQSFSNEVFQNNCTFVERLNNIDYILTLIDSVIGCSFNILNKRFEWLNGEIKVVINEKDIHNRGQYK